jgi:DNA-binding NtrC family response regulator
VNRSKSSATLLNGESVQERVIGVGDDLAVGSATFVVMPADASDIPDSLPISAISTTGMKSVFGNGLEEVDSGSDYPKTIREMADVFTLCKQASGCVNMATLVDVLVGGLRDRFCPKHVWVAQRHSDTVPLAPVEGVEDALDEMETAPLAAMEARTTAAKSDVEPAPHGADSALLFVCPIPTEGGGALVLAMQTDNQRVDTARDWVRFLTVLSAQIAPLVFGLQQAERWSKTAAVLSKHSGPEHTFRGESPAAVETRRMAVRAASTELPVLVFGETGAGKEIVSHLVHEASERSDGPFVICNCPAMPETLFESELFGHRRGAFTGADKDKDGLFHQAHGGTLFLDEIGDIGPGHQAKILRVLDTGMVRRVGDTEERHVDVRIVAATNRDLHTAVAERRFREDLFHRLCGFEIVVPPLRERKDDIPLLAEMFMVHCARATAQPVKGLSPDAIDALAEYDWPGNVRELRQVIGRSFSLADAPTLHADDITITTRSTAKRPDSTPLKPLEQVEREHILSVLDQVDWVRKDAVEILGISRDTLRRKIRDYKLSPNQGAY